MMKLFFIYLWLYVIEYNSYYNMTTNEQLKLKKINDGIDTYLIIVLAVQAVSCLFLGHAKGIEEEEVRGCSSITIYIIHGK